MHNVPLPLHSTKISEKNPFRSAKNAKILSNANLIRVYSHCCGSKAPALAANPTAVLFSWYSFATRLSFIHLRTHSLKILGSPRFTDIGGNTSPSYRRRRNIVHKGGEFNVNICKYVTFTCMHIHREKGRGRERVWFVCVELCLRRARGSEQANAAARHSKFWILVDKVMTNEKLDFAHSVPLNPFSLRFRPQIFLSSSNSS